MDTHTVILIKILLGTSLSKFQHTSLVSFHLVPTFIFIRFGKDIQEYVYVETAGLEPVLNHTEKSIIVSYYIQFVYEYKNV